MILTVLINPYLVRKIQVSGLKTDCLNEINNEHLAIGDSGVYSAHIIKILQAEPFVIGFSGGIGGRFIKNFLDKRRIVSDFISIDGEPRMLTILEDEEQRQEFSFLSYGYQPDENQLKALKHKFHNHVKECETIVFVGKLKAPQSIEKSEEVLGLIEEGQKAVVQVSAENMLLVAKYRPYVIITDLETLKAIGIENMENPNQFEQLRQWLHNHHIKYCFVQTKERIYGFSKSKIAFVQYLPRKRGEDIIKSSILGGVAIGVQRNYPFEKNLQMAGAIANQINIANFPDIIKRKEIDYGLNKVKIKEIYNEKNGYLEY